MKLTDLTWGILCLALGLGVFTIANGMEKSPYFQYGAGFYPSIIGAMLLLLLYRLFVGRRTTVP